MHGQEVNYMTWKYKKTKSFDKQKLFSEWDHEVMGLAQYDPIQGVITGEDAV